MRHFCVAVIAFLILPGPSVPQEKQSDKFAVYVVGGDDSRPVVEALIKKLRDSKPFKPVTREEPSKVVVLIECMHHDKVNEPFACMYVTHYNGATFKTFLGGGLYLSTTADGVADNFLSAVAADIVERFDKTASDNLKASLESCLFLTDSKCNVPDPLQKQFGKQITLGQYLLKQNQ